MKKEIPDFAKRFDEYIDQSTDYVREIAKLFYEWGLEDGAGRNGTTIYIPYPIKKSKRCGNMLQGEIQE